MSLKIEKALPSDFDSLWEIIQPVISKGDTYVFNPDTSKEEMLKYWFSEDKRTYKIIIDNESVGTYLLKDNQPGLGSHVCNASFMVHSEHTGKGIGKAMGEHALLEAKELGYSAMQFNFVVSTNTNAVKLWKSLGFIIVGQVPKAFNHRLLGLVDVYIMHKFL